MGFEQAWLSYTGKKEVTEIEKIQDIYVACDDLPAINGGKELCLALEAMTGKKPALHPGSPEHEKKEGAIIAGLSGDGKTEAYHLFEENGQIHIQGSDAKGILYGCFELIRQMQLGTPLKGIRISKASAMPLRMLNHWDNMDGSIERGYSGNSFFFEENQILVNERTKVYARLLASVGINGAVINNVNVKDNATWLITHRYFGKLRELSELFAGYGIKLFLSLNYAAPIELGAMEHADPLDEEVRQWWKEKMAEVFREIPNLGGFLIKADSEGRPGPFTYGRNHADGANMLAEAVKPYGGFIIWRCFVYNCRQDWRDYKTDRARSGYDNFMPLDGSFQDNVILQIKNGPMDFQVREPVLPLFGGLKATNQMLEVQIAQEYTGQQRHICYLIPMFQEILNFHTYAVREKDTVCDIVTGETFGQSNCGMAAVANTGNDENWTGHDLAAANLYGFGRLAFEPKLRAEEIASEWITLTFGRDKQVHDILLSILMRSRLVYEKYTAPLGIGWMVNPSNHYGPNVDGYEYDRWGTYHRADCLGIGVDRSEKGTGYAGLYNEPNASAYEKMESCPEELLLFFHHVPYTYRLKSGKTLIQHIYDTHFEGAEEVRQMREQFETLKGKLPQKAYERIQTRLCHQEEHSREWRDQINTYFYRKSGIMDEQGRKIY